MYAFIGRTPAAGKSYTAKQFGKESKLDMHLESIDDLRKEFAEEPKLKYWVDFFWNQDEESYWKTTSYREDTQNLVQQSEAFWKRILTTISETKKKYPHAIFEAVNILPHLAKKDLDFPGFFLICEDYKTVLERNIKEPRWGKTEELQKLEAKYFIEY